MGQTLIPTLTLNNLYDLWLQTTTNERVSATIGSSAKDFVMILGYARSQGTWFLKGPVIFFYSSLPIVFEQKTGYAVCAYYEHCFKMLEWWVSISVFVGLKKYTSYYNMCVSVCISTVNQIVCFLHCTGEIYLSFPLLWFSQLLL